MLRCRCSSGTRMQSGEAFISSLPSGRLEAPNDELEQRIADPHGRNADQEGSGMLRGDLVGWQRPVDDAEAWPRFAHHK